MSAKDIVEKAINGKLDEMKSSIYEMLSSKIDENIQLKKKEIAKNYFAQK